MIFNYDAQEKLMEYCLKEYVKLTIRNNVKIVTTVFCLSNLAQILNEKSI